VLLQIDKKLSQNFFFTHLSIMIRFFSHSFQMICQGLRQLAISQSTLPKADPRIAVAAASGAEAPPEELQEVISEVATNIHGFYVLKSSPEHPDFDPLRLYIYYFFFSFVNPLVLWGLCVNTMQ
jgi:hypothetical protein